MPGKLLSLLKGPASQAWFLRYGMTLMVVGVSAFMLLMAVMFYRQELVLRDARTMVVHAYKVSEQIGLLKSQLRDTEVAQLERAVNLRSAAAAEKWAIEEGALKRVISRLRVLTHDNRIHQDNLDALEAAVREYSDYIREHPWVKLSPNMKHYSADGKKLMDTIHRLVGSMDQQEKQLLAQRIEADESLVRQNVVLIYGIILLFYLCLVAAICVMMRHWRYAHRMEREATLRAQEVAKARLFLDNILHHVADPIFVKDSHHRFVDGNKAFWELIGHSREEALGKTDYDFFPKEQADIFWDKDELVLTRGQSNINVESLTNARGVEHILSTKKAAFDDGDGNAMLVGIIRDITELRRAQDKLKESDEERIRSIMNHSGRPVYIKDLDGKYLQANRDLQLLIGREEGEIIGKTDYDFFRKEEADRFRRNDLDVQQQKTSLEYEETVAHPDGDHTYISVKFPLYDANDELYAICGISTDITQRKRMEAKLIRYTKELERSNQELDDFAYIASHDLKEPLRGLFNHASFLMEDYGDRLDAEGVRRLQRLSQLCQRMEHLVNDLLYFSRLGRTHLAVQKTDLNKVIADICQMMESTLKERKAKVVMPQVLPLILCDRPRITEVFRNLITNAVKYNDKKAPKVEIGLLDEKDGPHGTCCRVFFVKDNGIGIEPAFYTDIFRIFRRLNTAATGEKGDDGTGVGLSFVKKIIERHGGVIWVESQPAKGSVFYFTIPEKESGDDGRADG